MIFDFGERALGEARPLDGAGQLADGQVLRRRQEALVQLAENITIASFAVAVLVFAVGVVSFELPRLLDDPASPDGVVVRPEVILNNATETLLNALKWSVVALLAGFIGDRWANALHQRARNLETKIGHEEITQAIYSSYSVQKVGSGREVLEALARSVSTATHVKNTFLNVGGAQEQDSEEEDEVRTIYEQFLLRPDAQVWNDIISVNELFSFRHRQIFTDAGGAPSGQKPRNAKHNIAVLRRSMPIINFVIIRKSSEVEAYFGWIFDKQRSSTAIYKTKDPALVEVFERYFDVLWAEKRAEEWTVKYAEPVDQRGPRRQFIVDRRGFWVTATYDAVTGKLVDRSIISIEFDQREPVVRGVAIRADSREQPHEFEHRNILEAPNSFVFEFQNAGRREMRSGICVYKFAMHKEEPVIRGHLLPMPDALERSATPRLLLAMRVPPECAARVLDAESATRMVGLRKERFDEFWKDEVEAIEAAARDL